MGAPLTSETSCWDGKNLDSPDHQSHLFNTAGEAFSVAGKCPDSHPVRVPQVAYETLWNTSMFNDKSLWPEDGSQPFVWSTGDPKGITTHADYLFGWKGDSLQRAMDADCFFQGCGGANGVLKTQGPSQMNRCTIKSTFSENIDGCKSKLRRITYNWVLEMQLTITCFRAERTPREEDGLDVAAILLAGCVNLVHFEHGSKALVMSADRRNRNVRRLGLDCTGRSMFDLR